MIHRNDATERQVQAALPQASTWLAANAGSGKTRVLTDRVARLLLADVPPEKILCLTYTKAAASEMQNRLFQRLGEWAMMPDANLAEQLQELGEDEALTPARLASARTLFARAIETPGGLKIQTIHSFCASLLRRFPLEAGVSPQFSEMEDRAAALMRAEIVEDLADGPHAEIVRALAVHLSDPDFEQITAQIAAHRAGFEDPLTRAQIADLLGLPEGADFQTVLAQAMPPGCGALVEAVLPTLRAQSKTMVALADSLATIDWDHPGRDSYDALCKLFLMGSGAKPEAKTKSVPTKKARADLGELAGELHEWMEHVAEAKALELSLIAVSKSAALHDFAAAFLPEYARRKAVAGTLDFDDLVLKTRDLLRDPSVAEWVLYRLDGGIDHILVDEAQDTSPAQWDVVDRLAQEFTAGEGARETERTIFVVGDKKQSIYSFQGADPDGFDRMQTAFAERLGAMGRHLQDLVLEYSFRSSSAILSVVDAVFDGQDSAGFGAEGRHRAFKDALPGRVDLWPVVEAIKDDDDRHWTDPVDRVGQRHHAVILAEEVADQIAHMIAHETLPDGQGQRRPVRAGDVLVLVQRRSDLFAEIIRACKSRGLPIAGADRLKVGAELAVKDLAALLRFLDTPEDDLSLAEVLKSPLFGWDEQSLYTLAHHRPKGRFLWEELRNQGTAHAATMDVLQDLRDNADFLRPYDLIERILTRHDGRRKLLGRLGAEAEDGINALLSQALGYERSAIPSLTGFLQWMETDELEIKRQVASGGDLIRVMTVHGSKGLEAPIVILPDTAKRSPRAETGVIEADGTPLWRTPADQAPDVLADAIEEAARKRAEENQRLLYVALTRAEVWLIVAAAGTLDEKDGNSWYQQIETALQALGGAPHTYPGGEGLRLTHGDWDAGEVQTPTSAEVNPVDLPHHLLTAAPDPAPRRETLSPSDLGGAKALPGASGADEDVAKARGTALHVLLEHLPDAAQADWPDLARHVLRDMGDAADDLLAEASKVLTSPALAHLFTEDTLAEVALTARLGSQTLYGQIDRLIVESNRVLAVDFKSNAVIPENAAAVPEGLLRQMGAYAHALAQIYPDRRIETAILWTRDARLMPLPHDMVMAAMHRADTLDGLPKDT